jgi:hypothetical protein
MATLSASDGGFTAPSETPSAMATTSSALQNALLPVRQCFQHAKEIRRLHNDRSDIILQRRPDRCGLHRAAFAVADLLHMQPGILGVGLQDFAVFRMHGSRHQHAAASG